VSIDPLELAEWRGRTNQRLDDHDRQFKAITEHVGKSTDAIQTLAVEVGKLGVKVAFWSFGGGACSAGLAYGISRLLGG